MSIAASAAPRVARAAGARPAAGPRDARSAADAFPGLLAAASPTPAPVNALGGSGGAAPDAAPRPAPANQFFGATVRPATTPAAPVDATTAVPATGDAAPASPAKAGAVAAATAAAVPGEAPAAPPAPPAPSTPAADAAADATTPLPTPPTAAATAAAPAPPATANAAAAVDPQLLLDVTLATALAAVNGALTGGGDGLADAAGAGGTATAPGGASATPEAIRRQVATQLLREAGPVPGEGRVTLRLDPPHLGRVDVKIEKAGDVLTVTFTAQTPEVERALRDGSGDLQRALAASGGRWGEVRIRVDETRDGGGAGAEQDETGSGREQSPGRRDRRQEG